MRGSHLPHPKSSLQSVKFSLSYAMRIMFCMFPLPFWYLVPENVKQFFFAKFGLACMHTRPLEYLDVPILLRPHAP